MIDKNIINANIKLQDINKILEKENVEYKKLLLACYKVLSKYEDDEAVYYLLQDIREALGL